MAKDRFLVGTNRKRARDSAVFNGLKTHYDRIFKDGSKKQELYFNTLRHSIDISGNHHFAAKFNPRYINEYEVAIDKMLDFIEKYNIPIVEPEEQRVKRQRYNKAKKVPEPKECKVTRLEPEFPKCMGESSGATLSHRRRGMVKLG
jgi:hypothetical protein